MSTSTIPVIPEPNTSDDVLFNSNLGLRTIELNRPEKFNALNQSMAQKIVPRLQVRTFPPLALPGVVLSLFSLSL